MEIISSGVLLLDKLSVRSNLDEHIISLNDPCDLNNKSLFLNINQQSIEDLTTSAHHALRLLSFNKINDILV